MTSLFNRLALLVSAEDGQAMNSSASFLCGCALLAAGVYYCGGDRIQGFVSMIVNSPPPGTSDTLFH